MEIILQDIGKKYGRSWIFRHLNYEFFSGNGYAILGSNGSGKSTLLQLISGYLSQSEGHIHYQQADKKLQPDHFFRHIGMATPYMELPEELTLHEMLTFHSRFKQPLIHLEDIPVRIGLAKERDKEIKHFSSGMRQRLRLALTVLFQSDIVLLDEPTTHLDVKAISWYLELLKEHIGNRCLIISSNQPEEYALCTNYLYVEEYK
jgi:ABC-type multidrug transport system ATPase subunit